MRRAIGKRDGCFDREASRSHVDHGHRQTQGDQMSVKLPQDLNAVPSPAFLFEGGRQLHD